MRIALRNIGTLLTGKVDDPIGSARTVVIEDGVIAEVTQDDGASVDLAVDCRETTVGPGLIDTHIHPVIGDFSPKQSALGYFGALPHGAVTTGISAGEVHTPGRDGTAETALSIATTAHRLFANHRPGGLKVLAGAMLLEEDATPEHLERAADAGVELIGEVGVGTLKDSDRAGELVKHAADLGIRSVMHCGGTSDRSPRGEMHAYFSAFDVRTVGPTVASHVNSFVSMSADDISALCDDGSDRYLEVVFAGGTRALMELVDGLAQRGSLDRMLVGTDTPTGFGISPLGMLKVIGDVASLCDVPPAVAWAIASGNAADAFGLAQGRLEVGAPADLVVFDAALGSPRGQDALGALAGGELPGIALTIVDGEVVVDGSVHSTRARRVPVIHHR